MENAKHTPGPWEATRNSSYWEVIPKNGGDNGIPFSVADVCCSAPGEPDGGLQEANARLIAAAPELLEALEYLLDEMSEMGATEKNNDAVAKVRAAIAKATGSTQSA